MGNGSDLKGRVALVFGGSRARQHQSRVYYRLSLTIDGGMSHELGGQPLIGASRSARPASPSLREGDAGFRARLYCRGANPGAAGLGANAASALALQ